MSSFSALSASTYADYLEQSAGGEDIPTPDVPTVPDGFYGEMMVAAAEMLAELATGSVILVNEAVTASTSDDPYAPDTINPTDLAVNAVVIGYSSDRIDGQQILVGDVRVILDASLIVTKPVKGQTIKIDGTAHNLINVKPVPAAGVTSVYILQARSGN